jgi:hypothetical protein
MCAWRARLKNTLGRSSQRVDGFGFFEMHGFWFRVIAVDPTFHSKKNRSNQTCEHESVDVEMSHRKGIRGVGFYQMQSLEYRVFITENKPYIFY